MTTRPPHPLFPRSPTIRPRLAAAWLSVLVALSVVACGRIPPDEAPGDAPAAEVTQSEPATLPLRAIMVGLADDMAGAAMGIWTEDATAIARGAGGIADHPRVPPEQMSIIQATLGQEFAEFVAFDQLVHGLAVQLRDGALAAQPTSDLVNTFTEMAEGCVACHAAFRARVSSALSTTP